MSRLDFLSDRYVRLTAQIERWEAKPQTEKRIAKIERKKTRLAMTLSEIESIQKRNQLEADFAERRANSTLPVDTFDISIKRDGVTGMTMVDIDTYDSPFDDSFIGGEPLMLMVHGTGRPTPNGFSSFTHRSTLANGQYWTGLSRQTLMSGSSTWSNIEEYPEVAITVAKDKGNWRDGKPMGDILAIQSFKMTDYVIKAA